MNALDVIRTVELEWAVRQDDVWAEPPYDVPELQEELRAAFARRLADMERSDRVGSPLGWVVTGPGGSGKTHLLAAFRREAAGRKHPFIMVDLTDVREFWASVLQGYVHSLQQRLEGDVPQFRWVLGNIIEKLGPNKPVARILAMLADQKSTSLKADMNKVLAAMNQVWPRETMKYQNVIRSVICMNSEDFSISNLGQTWLQGQPLEPEDRRDLGFTTFQETPKAIVEALSWFMSLSGPTVLAFDQLDPIIAQLHYRKQGDPSTEERATAESIIADVGGGLGALRDFTRNTLTIVACLESTWKFLLDTTLRTFLDRFEAPRTMRSLQSGDRARAVARARLEAAYRASGFVPPYPTYPFLPEAFDRQANSSPRQVLKRCKEKIDRMIEADLVREVASLDPREDEPEAHPAADGRLDRLDREFETLRGRADPAWILEEKHDDERLAPLLRSGLTCLAHEAGESDDVYSTVEVEFTGGAKTAPLHARLKRVFPREQEREDHYCVRAIQHSNARAYQNQLTAALTNSGIDRRLKFRRLAIVRSTPAPGGAKTAELTSRFESLGGVFVTPADDDLRALHALDALRRRNDPDFLPWLRARKLASGLPLIRGIVGPGFEAPAAASPPVVVEPPALPPTVPKPSTNGDKLGTPTSPQAGGMPVVPLGRKWAGGKAHEPLTLPVHLLERHTLVMAGAGSGKTMFLRRLVEEAALVGVPSIVVDCANDLAALGDRWESPPDKWGDGDAEKADRYHVPGRVVVWTPNRAEGNPLWFEPLPDLAALVDDREELDAAVDAACEALLPIVAKGRSQASDMKRAILSGTLRYMASRGGRGMDDLIEILSDLPQEAGLGVSKAAKYAVDMADLLRAARAVDPLLRSRGTPFDPALLFGPSSPGSPARVSVISLVGLGSLESQRAFLNQLAMTLFSWIKKNPDPGARPLRGLLVIDEAKDFIPSQKVSTCRESLLRLGAQARKYHLGLVFATQNPKDVDNRLMSNCSTHVYGKMNSPATIAAVQDLIRLKGGSGDDIPRLPAGRFHVHNADAGMPAPVRVEAAFSLSRHPANPLDEPAVLARAAASRPG
jgi:GTPase SAR1 family protein